MYIVDTYSMADFIGEKWKIGLHHIPAILLTQAGPDKAPASWQPTLHSQTRTILCFSFEVAMAIDWKRVLSDVPLENPHDNKTAYFVSPLFSTRGHTSR